MVRALSIDVGSTSIRTSIVDLQGIVSHVHQQQLTVTTPQPGEVELDAIEIGRIVLELAARTLDEGGLCEVVGITNQRATTIIFDPLTGVPLGPALGWQDLRTVIDCLVLQGEGLHLMPNQSATKARWLVAASGREQKELRFATVETWVTWLLTEGAVHVTDRSNAGVNGLVSLDLATWDERTLSVLGLEPAMLPRIVDTMALHGVATALAGSPRITALIGDQPAALFGLSCVSGGAKITFGTGAMLDMVSNRPRPQSLSILPSGCFPTVLRSQDGDVTWGVEAIVFAAGACLEWLRDDLALIDEPAQSEALARSVDSCDGVSFVPALSGLGTPRWDFGARGGFFGITRGTTKAHLVRAVLEGIAQRGADLVDAAQTELGVTLEELRVDGGMTANRFFVQCLADFSGLRVTVSSEREATTRGAGLMALVSAGFLSLDDVERLWSPAEVFTPQLTAAQRAASRATWARTVTRVEKTIPELSAIQF
ncbi:MAG: FGGY-family carbohydrate kinase [Acidimicrobiales bacterium]